MFFTQVLLRRSRRCFRKYLDIFGCLTVGFCQMADVDEFLPSDGLCFSFMAGSFWFKVASNAHLEFRRLEFIFSRQPCSDCFDDASVEPRILI